MVWLMLDIAVLNVVQREFIEKGQSVEYPLNKFKLYSFSNIRIWISSSFGLAYIIRQASASIIDSWEYCQNGEGAILSSEIK